MESPQSSAKQQSNSGAVSGQRPPKGIPSSEQLYLPRKDSLDDVLKKPGAIRTATAWGLSDVLQFVFPKQYRAAYHEVAMVLLEEMQKNGGHLQSAQLVSIVEGKGISKATLYNKVIPRLVRVGMIERNRTPGSKKLNLSWSNQFATYLDKIAFEWKRLEPRNMPI